MDLSTGSSRGRRLLFFILYLSEGGPIGLLWWALPAHLRLLGLPLPSITLLSSLLVLPWALKFLWAPLIDSSRARGFPLPIWIGSAQMVMALTLLPLIFLDVQEDFLLLISTLILHAVAASTQDAAIDAYAIRTVPPQERGTINAFMQAGMLLGRGTFGGSTLVLISLLGFGGAVAVLIMTLLLIAGFVLRFLENDPGGPSAPGMGVRATLELGWRVLKERGVQSGFIVAILAGAGFEGVGAVAGPYLVDRGYSAEVIGVFFAAITTSAMLLGAFLGGRWADRHDRASTARVGVMLMAAIILLLALSDSLMTPGGAVRILILGTLYLTIGYFTASSYTLFMDLTDPRIGATQFSAYMAGTNVCEAWSAFAVGRLTPALGYPLAFGMLAGVSLLSLPAFRVIQARRAGAIRQDSSPQGEA